MSYTRDQFGWPAHAMQIYSPVKRVYGYTEITGANEQFTLINIIFIHIE